MKDLKRMSCAGCTCDGQLYSLQAADPNDQEKRAGSWPLEKRESLKRPGEREKREGGRENKRGDLKGEEVD